MFIADATPTGATAIVVRVHGAEHRHRLPAVKLEGVAQGSYWQLITSTFLHVQILHIALNMFGLWFFGPFLEHSSAGGGSSRST